MTEIFRTERTIVRPWQMSDLPHAFRIYGDPEFAKVFNLPAHTSLEQSAESLQSRIKRTEAMPEGFGMWAIQRLTEGDVVGTVVLKTLPDDTRIEVGWHLWPGVWGEGYATETGAGAMALGFGHHKLDEIFAIIRPENHPSQAVAGRLRMVKTGESLMHFGMLHEYWRRAREDWLEHS